MSTREPSAAEAALLVATLETDVRELLRDYSPDELREMLRTFLNTLRK
jgi:hypothetical protein